MRVDKEFIKNHQDRLNIFHCGVIFKINKKTYEECVRDKPYDRTTTCHHKGGKVPKLDRWVNKIVLYEIPSDDGIFSCALMVNNRRSVFFYDVF